MALVAGVRDAEASVEMAASVVKADAEDAVEAVAETAGPVADVVQKGLSFLPTSLQPLRI